MPEPGASGDPPDQGGGVRNRKQKQQQKTADSTSQSSTTNQETNQPTASQPNVSSTNTNGNQPPVQFLPEDVMYVPANRIIFAVPKWLLVILTLIMGVFFIAGGGYIGDVVWKKYMMDSNGMYGESSIFDTVEASIGEEAVHLFKTYDRNSDSKLSLQEYEALFHALAGSGFNVIKIYY